MLASSHPSISEGSLSCFPRVFWPGQRWSHLVAATTAVLRFLGNFRSTPFLSSWAVIQEGRDLFLFSAFKTSISVVFSKESRHKLHDLFLIQDSKFHSVISGIGGLFVPNRGRQGPLKRRKKSINLNKPHFQSSVTITAQC
jgi:hypothetical protein